MNPAPAPTSGTGTAAASALGSPLLEAGRYIAQSFRLMVGQPSYDTYVAHRQRTHPGEPVMSYEAFFRERQEARYGGGKGRMGRCC